ncbi:uncharacterized protein LOC129335729 [Eublepharis macularius]|uniref:Uncharacterized protein LOC129335729 n=1 Tax=Eublepharis macularius TaxID=481883 RepID=A0AA97JWP1_EUBMA|nr:uncharacterized protein LOC129335729 [Eublepharis macularius]
MPANVEIKARVRNLAQLVSHAERLSGSPGHAIVQTDTFFSVPCGRLKLRDFRDGRGQLIFYDRPDTEGPKLSHYAISSTEDPAGLAVVLSQALGVKGVVKKERRLYIVGQTRVHVDRVEGLGDFMELEQTYDSWVYQGHMAWPGGGLFVRGPLRLSAALARDEIREPSLLPYLQVVLEDQQSPRDGERVAQQLMAELGVGKEDLLSGAYLDLLAGGAPRP